MEEIKNQKIRLCEFIDVHKELGIERSDQIQKQIVDLKFSYSQVKHPLLVYDHRKYKTEITIKEKQKAVGNQAMLYFCIPIQKVKTQNGQELLNRKAEKKEKVIFVVDKNNCKVILKVAQLFNLLSKNHNYDINQILDEMINPKIKRLDSFI